MAELYRIDGSTEAASATLLPQNVEAEAALLGALMVDNRLVEDVQLKLKPLHFFEPLHGRIYDAILRMTDKNMVANPVTLRPIFELDEAMKEVGGASYLAQLTGSGAAIIGARDFAQQINDLALLRELSAVGREMDENALETEQQYTMYHPSEVELASTTKLILEDVKKLKPARVVFDSLSELRLVAGNPLRYRRQILALKQYFSGRQCTVILLDDMTASGHDLHVQSFVHGVIFLQHLSPEYGAERRRLRVV